ncbi:hypothetical protein M1349_03730 [Patescibacteria group bacterium]|nr:hypothetical protein [Patescibacteria group bacterium]
METEKSKEQSERKESFDEKKDSSRLQEEIDAGEWQRLREFETYKKRSRQGKIIAMHQAISNRIKQLELLFYQLVANHPQKAKKLLEEIKRLRFLREFLLQCLIWEERGELEDHDMPGELESLI